MSFSRGRAQLRCEELLGCAGNFERWNQSDFINFSLPKDGAKQLKEDLLLDAKDLYFKGLLSLFECIFSISRLFFSWATIKAYYSVFYFLRCSLATKGYGLIRNKSLYLIKAAEGEKPVRKGNRKYNSDHEGTINFYQDVYNDSDILLSNEINEKTAYTWLMKRREQISYRERNFHEPMAALFWEYIYEIAKAKNLAELIDKYVDDQFLYCFQEEHAALAIPIKRALLTKDDLLQELISPTVSDEKITSLQKLAQFEWKKYNLIKLLCS